MPEQKPAKKPGVTRVRAPKDLTALSVEGFQYEVEKGFLDVQDVHVPHAVEHGCEPVNE